MSIHTRVCVHLYEYLQIYEFSMNLNMIRPKNETEEFLLSKTKNCEKLIKQTRTKAEEILEFK